MLATTNTATRPTTPRTRDLWKREQYVLALFNDAQDNDAPLNLPPSMATSSAPASAVGQPERRSPEIGFVPASFCFTTFPLREPKNPTEAFAREDENFAVTIDPDTKQFPGGPRLSFRVPYGSLPRLLMVWIASELAKPNRAPDDPVLQIGSIRSWFESMGVSWGSHRLPAAKDQLIRLANCRFHLIYRNHGRVAMQPENLFALNIMTEDAARHYHEGQTDPSRWKDAMTKIPWPEALVLRKSMIPHLREYAVPLPPQVLAKVANNPMALDVLFYLCYVAPRIDPGETELLTWQRLIRRFGNGERAAKFRDRFLPSLQAALDAYPEVTARLTAEGMIIHHSNPAALRHPYFAVQSSSPRPPRNTGHRRLPNRFNPLQECNPMP